MNNIQNVDGPSFDSDLFLSPSNATKPPVWIEISKSAFDHNVGSIAMLLGNQQFGLVIKSNAYGHGLEQIAALAHESPQIDYVCVISLSEAIRVRMLGIKKPILVLSIIDCPLEFAAQHNIDVTLYNRSMVKEIIRASQRMLEPLAIHIKVDTGLSRFGLTVQEAQEIIPQIVLQPTIQLKGLYTHFAESNAADQTYTNLQAQKFAALVTSLKQQGIVIPIIHQNNSAGAITQPNDYCTMARIGAAAYGFWSSEYVRKVALERTPNITLKQCLQVKTSIINIKEVPTGSFVGYDRTFTTTRPSRLAQIPIGYADGFDRRYTQTKKTHYVLVNQQPAPVIGLIAMNSTTVDVTDINAHVGDLVTVIGNESPIGACDLANILGTGNPREVTTYLPATLPRRTIP